MMQVEVEYTNKFLEHFPGERKIKIDFSSNSDLFWENYNIQTANKKSYAILSQHKVL